MRSLVLRFVFAALAPFAWAPASPASAEDVVKFETAAPLSGGGKTELQGYLTKPKGAGPFPAIVLLHSCLGLPSNRRALGAEIAGWGYVALFVDDFSTRGLKETCAVDFNEAMADAFGALVFVSGLPDVDPTRIAAVGFSQGADTALQIAAMRFAGAFNIPDNVRFKAVAALYPPCANQAGAPLRLSTLILVGAQDQVTPAADCERLAKIQSGANVTLIVYPGAGHVFDDPAFAGGKRVYGMWLEYDRKAAAQSKSALRDFLAARLGR
jgi:dienelactone hydrolase